MFNSKKKAAQALAKRIESRKEARKPTTYKATDLELAYNARQALERDSFGILTVKAV